MPRDITAASITLHSSAQKTTLSNPGTAALKTSGTHSQSVTTSFCPTSGSSFFKTLHWPKKTRNCPSIPPGPHQKGSRGKEEEKTMSPRGPIGAKLSREKKKEKKQQPEDPCTLIEFGGRLVRHAARTADERQRVGSATLQRHCLSRSGQN